MIEVKELAKGLAVKTSNLTVSVIGIKGAVPLPGRLSREWVLTPGSSGFLVGGCLRSPLVDYVNVTVIRNDTPTQQVAGAYVMATHPHQGFY